MALDLATAIGEIEERITALRFRASRVDVAPESMLDEVAKLLQEARSLVKRLSRSAHPANMPSAVQPVDVAAREDDWSEMLRHPYFRTDSRGIVTSANSAACELIKLPKYFVLGRPLTMFAGPESRHTLRTQINRLTTIERVDQVEANLCRTDGEVVLGSFSVAAIFTNGQLGGARWVFYARDGKDGAGISSSTPLPGESVGRRMAFLAQASGTLARSLDFEATLTAFATISIPMLGDWCIMDVLHEDGSVHRPTVTCARTEPADLRMPLQSCAPLVGTDRTAVADVLRGGAAQIIRNSMRDFPAMLASTGEELALLRRLNISSALIVPLSARGQTLGAVTFLFAGSRRRHGPADLALAQDLAARVGITADHARLFREVQHANQSKSDFLAAMSHELRTPLTAVIGYTEILRDEIVGSLEPIQKEQLSRIRASSEHLLVLVEEILSFARLEAGGDHVTIEQVDVHALVEQAFALVATQARVRQLSMVTDIPYDLPNFSGDAPKVRQILVNLLANAVKFTQRGEIGVSGEVNAPWIVFTVWDTGIGIPPEHLDHIFDPFWQVDQKSTHTHGGSGLGLAVVRRLARLMGGDVAATSEAGRGSRFVVRLPLAGPPTLVERELSSDARAPDGRSGPS